MSDADRDTLITAIAAASGGLPLAGVLDALTAAGYRVVGPAEQAVLDAADEWQKANAAIHEFGRSYAGDGRLVMTPHELVDAQVNTEGALWFAVRAARVAGSTNQEPAGESSDD